MTKQTSSRPELVTEEYASSSEEALCDMLGLPSLDGLAMHAENVVDDEPPYSLDHLLGLPESELHRFLDKANVLRDYADQSVCSVPEELCLDPSLMRRITDELTWGQHKSDKSYETIKVISRGEILERRKVTRFENFVKTHKDWTRLCDYIGRITSIICQQPMVLFKEKLNLKPPGGSGFAPHLDTPSLRVALGNKGPQNFVTVMIAIDAMSEQNGCLQFVKGKWSQETAVDTIQPKSEGNPDADGRAGAIPTEVADKLPFEPFVCPGGTIACFNGWTPHRSAANGSAFPRRAVFLTYNPREEGDCRDQYYEQMARLRSEFQAKAGLDRQQVQQIELDALATIPKI